MDANKDGNVTKDELKTLLKGLGEEVTDEVVDEMIAIADENGDGKVQFEEFFKASTSTASSEVIGSNRNALSLAYSLAFLELLYYYRFFFLRLR